jgi:molecular chaperone GrpE
MAAEYDNFRRRSAKEREGVYTEAYGDAIAQVLPVIDNMERAALYSDAEKVAEGVKMTLKSFSDILERMGITSFGEPGDAFDPVLHNAVMHVEDETLGESVIKEVFQKGYKKGDKVIRYAMVIVAN